MKNIIVFGAGGVGGYFGGKLACYFQNKKEKSSQVYFIARGEHLKAIQTNGLVLDSSEGTFNCRPEKASDSIQDLPGPDLIILCVKSYDLENAVREVSEAARDNTVILPLLNGVDIVERTHAVLKTGIVLPACVYVGTHIEKPGVVRQRGGDARILFGKDLLNPEYQAAEIKDIFDKAGIKHQWIDDPYPAIWEKYLFIAGYGLVTADSGKSIGEVFADNGLKNLVRSIMNEVYSIAEKKGVRFEPGTVEKSLSHAGAFPFETRTSYQRDMETPGRKNEGDLFGGTIIRMGRETGIPVPYTRQVYFSLLNKKLNNN